jgi:hypothetical protein
MQRMTTMENMFEGFSYGENWTSFEASADLAYECTSIEGIRPEPPTTGCPGTPPPGTTGGCPTQRCSEYSTCSCP